MRKASNDRAYLDIVKHDFTGRAHRSAGDGADGGRDERRRMLGEFQELEVDFISDNPGSTLFHCHQQVHMDFGFMAAF